MSCAAQGVLKTNQLRRKAATRPLGQGRFSDEIALVSAMRRQRDRSLGVEEAGRPPLAVVVLGVDFCDVDRPDRYLELPAAALGQPRPKKRSDRRHVLRARRDPAIEGLPSARLVWTAEAPTPFDRSMEALQHHREVFAGLVHP